MEIIEIKEKNPSKIERDFIIHKSLIFMDGDIFDYEHGEILSFYIAKTSSWHNPDGECSPPS